MKMIQQQRTAHDKIKQARQTHENRIKVSHFIFIFGFFSFFLQISM